ncbi:MAG: acyltransferase [Acidimicrobiia bacterium]|nr:acyltransferase [Acidimicrobiia bacterium]
MKFLARLWGRLTGWKFIGTAPDAKKMVIIGVPHTSNWDFVLFLAVTSHFGIEAKVIGKHTLVKGPFGWLMRGLGVIPVERGSGQGLVEAMIDEFDKTDELALVIAPEGTRGSEEYWRSGFYRIATGAQIPLVMAMVDAINKTIVLHDPLTLTGDVSEDMTEVRARLESANGINPAGASQVRLRAEDSE